MLGRCPGCDTLQTISGRAPKIPYPNNPSALDYYPDAHKLKDENGEVVLDKNGKPIWCDGARKAIL